MQLFCCEAAHARVEPCAMHSLGCRTLVSLCLISCFIAAPRVAAQSGDPAAPGEAVPAPGSPADAGAGVNVDADTDASVGEPPPAEPPLAEPPPRGDVPVALETVVDPNAVVPAEPQATDPAAPPPEAAPQPPAKKPARPEAEPRPAPAKPTEPPQAATGGRLIVWAATSWASALGPARCGEHGLERAELAIRIASTMKRSSAAAGIGVAPAGVFSDHPVITYAAKHAPQLLAELLAESGFSAIAVGVADLSGSLLRDGALSLALRDRGIRVIASNLECAGQSWCETWATADDPLPILERDGKRYAFISVLPDDVLGRVEPAAGRRIQLQSAGDTLVERTAQARDAGVDLVIATIDHGPDATASVNLANFLAEMPVDVRPDLLLSPSAGDNLLFMRPLDVHPAVVGTRAGVLTGLRVTKLVDTHDADVFARSVRVNDWDEAVAARVAALGRGFCRARARTLAGGHLQEAMTHDELVQLAAEAARELAGADLAVVDPLSYDTTFAQPKTIRLQMGEAERAVVLDAPLMVAYVTLDWLGNLNRALTGLRPLALIGTATDQGATFIAGRLPIPGALYRIVTTSVLVRSGRLPDGASWAPLERKNATLRRSLVTQLDQRSEADPRSRVHDPLESTQWVLRADGQIQASLTAVENGDPPYEEPALQVNNSRQLGARLVLNLDADAPDYLFENALQVAFDRNFETRTTAQDLIFLQTTYTYRGLWSRALLYPHPFIEAYVESQFDRGEASYHHLLFRPEAGFRSQFSRVLSLKLSAGFQYEALDPNRKVFPGVGAELLLKPWGIALDTGTLQLEGSITYYWNAPGERDEHTLRGQLITAVQLIGPLQLTLTALGVLRKDGDVPLGKGVSIQAGLRLRFVDRTMVE